MENSIQYTGLKPQLVHPQPLAPNYSNPGLRQKFAKMANGETNGSLSGAVDEASLRRKPRTI